MTIAATIPNAPLAPQTAVNPPPSLGAGTANTIARQTVSGLTANAQAEFRPGQLPQTASPAQTSTNARVTFLAQGSGGAAPVVSLAPPAITVLPAPLPLSYTASAPILLNNPSSTPFAAQFIAQSGGTLRDDDVALFETLNANAAPKTAKQALQQQQQLNGEQQQLLRDMQVALGGSKAEIALRPLPAATQQAANVASKPVQQAPTQEEPRLQTMRRDSKLKQAVAGYYQAVQSRLEISEFSDDTARIA